MDGFFIPQRNISTQEIESVHGKLLYIVKESFMDISFVKLSKGLLFARPMKRDGYRFYIQSEETDGYENPKMLLVSTRLSTVCCDEKSILRGRIDIYETTAEEVNNNMRFYYYFPKNKKVKIDIKKTWNDGLGYEFFIEGKSIGFISEYGEYHSFNELAEGSMHFFFEDSDVLIKNKKETSLYNFADDFKGFETEVKDAFPDYHGSLVSTEGLEIIAATRTKKVNFLVKKRNRQKGDRYYIVRHAKFEKRVATGEDFEIFSVDPTRFCYSSGHLIKHHKYTNVFDTNHAYVNGILDIVKGFSIDEYELGNPTKMKALNTCIFVRDELVEFTTYERVQ